MVCSCQAVTTRRTLTVEDLERDRKQELDRARRLTSAPEEDEKSDAARTTTTSACATMTSVATAAEGCACNVCFLESSLVLVQGWP